MSSPYWLRVLIAIDQLGNAIIGRSPDRTLSSSIGERIKKGEANKLELGICWFLRKLENEHCLKSIGK